MQFSPFKWPEGYLQEILLLIIGPGVTPVALAKGVIESATELGIWPERPVVGYYMPWSGKNNEPYQIAMVGSKYEEETDQPPMAISIIQITNSQAQQTEILRLWHLAMRQLDGPIEVHAKWDDQDGPYTAILNIDEATPEEIRTILRDFRTFLRTELRQRTGGPKAIPDEVQKTIVKGWEKVKGKVHKEDYAAAKGISARHLTRLEKKWRSH